MKYNLAILAIFKNEEMVFKEWIDHYLWQGVEHFYLIDNGSTDNYIDILRPYIDMKYITLYSLPEPYKQTEHYNTVFNQIRDLVDWLMVCDIDEYWFGTRKKIIDNIKELPVEYNRIRGHWHTFGSSGYNEQPECIRESFIHRREDIRFRSGESKCIIKTEVTTTLDVHNHIHIISQDRDDSPNGWNTIEDDNLVLFHYQTMSREYFEKVKMTRGDVISADLNPIRDWRHFNFTDWNDYKDTRLADLVKNGYGN